MNKSISDGYKQHYIKKAHEGQLSMFDAQGETVKTMQILSSQKICTLKRKGKKDNIILPKYSMADRRGSHCPFESLQVDGSRLDLLALENGLTTTLSVGRRVVREQLVGTIKVDGSG